MNTMKEEKNEYIQNSGSLRGISESSKKRATRRFYQRRLLFLAVVTAFCIAFVAYQYLTYVPPPPPTPEQVLALKQEESRQLQIRKEQDQMVAQKAEYNNYWCHKKSICNRYWSARQECAVAGNFDNCVTIKLGEDFQEVSSCSSEGESPGRPN